MEIIEKIKERLKRYPHVNVEESDNSIRILPVSDDGFEVAIRIGEPDDDERIEISFDGWHERFSDESEALDCFAFGLSDECRLKEYSRGGCVYRWTLEFLENEVWHEESTMGLFLFPFWRSKKVRYLQNHLISSNEPLG